MKEILDFVVLALFVFMVFMFIRGFNKQQIAKHNKKIAENEKKNSDKEIIDE